MEAKERNKDSLSNNRKMTRHFYLSNSLFDNLIKESVEKDVNVSSLVEQKLKTLDEIKFLILKNREDKKEK